MTPALRKIALTVHVIASVGWFGAVGAFLALALAGLASDDPVRIRAAYIGMELTGWSVIVPLALATLVTGLVSSLGTTWGLFRHYWVVIKLVMTVPATLLLLLHMQPISGLARIAADSSSLGAEHGGLRLQVVAQAAAALVVLLVATALSIYKPRGLTAYGWRRHYLE